MRRCPPPTGPRASGAWRSRSSSRWATSPIRSWRRSRRALPKLRIGPGTDPDSEMGPLVTGEHRDKVASYVDRGYDEGATIVVDGRERAFDGDGFFLGVSLLDNVTPDMDVYRDEIFGPVLCVVRAASYDEAVRLVDENPYGNGTAIFTRDGGARPPLPVRRAGRHGRRERADSRSPSRRSASEAGSRRCSATATCTAPTASTSTRAPRSSRPRWPDPSTSRVDLGFPQTR